MGACTHYPCSWAANTGVILDTRVHGPRSRVDVIDTHKHGRLYTLPMFMGREHGCHFRHPCSRPLFTIDVIDTHKHGRLYTLPMFMGREHGCHFRHTWSWPGITGSVYRAYCKHQCNQLAGKSRLQNDLVCVKCCVKKSVLILEGWYMAKFIRRHAVKTTWPQLSATYNKVRIQ